MRRGKNPSMFRWRALTALACAAALLFNVFALGHARGVVATKHVQTAMIAAATGQPCPPTTHGRTICPLSTFVPSSLAEGSVVQLPGEERIVHFAMVNDIPLSPRASDAPFRPPRMG
jgi:hypothetical protein